ncbi:MAG: YceI family protein [Pseudomonadota bacterium]|nr:YceI family protein [Pseudomonadota bacterium]
MKYRLLLVSLLLSCPTFAAINWSIDHTNSIISFTATQNNAPVTGKFTSFTGAVTFSPEQLNESKATLTVDINSVKTSYALVGETLKTGEWFDAAQFPKGIFKSTVITKTGDNTFVAKGTLTLRNKTLPIDVKFTLEKFTATDAKVTGTTTIKRTAFGIGRGDWSKTDEIKDDVLINFTIIAKETGVKSK